MSTFAREVTSFFRRVGLAMLGVSESQLRQWVIEGKVRKPYRSAKMSSCSMR